MEEHIITTEQMESLKALSQINLEISEARNLLFKLQEEETEYLVKREKKAMDRIKKTVSESQKMVQEANQNHGQIRELSVGISNFVQNLLRIQENYQLLIVEFDEKNIEWEKDIGKQQDDIAENRKELKLQKVQLDNDRKSLELANKKLANDQRKLTSDRGTIQRTINRLKENKIP